MDPKTQPRTHVVWWRVQEASETSLQQVSIASQTQYRLLFDTPHFGVDKIVFFERSLLCLPVLHSFDKYYSKNSNIVKDYYNLK